MKILAIETSCDETAISIVNAKGAAERAKLEILSNIVSSQIEIHAQYGGVYPMVAKREHSKALIPVLKEALTESRLLKQEKIPTTEASKIKKITKMLEREPELLAAFLNFIPTIKKPAIDLITVTSGPGLEPALWVGINFAKALSLYWDMDVVPVNHMEGHILSAMIQKKEGNSTKASIGKISVPAIALLISGGHTELVLTKELGKYKIIGQTRDDAIGEAFDKVARILGLPYPGGPEISKLAEGAELDPSLKLPRPMIHSGDFDFSFSGIKTAVLYMVQKIENITPKTKATIAKEFENSVTEVLVFKTLKAIEKYKAKTLIIGGGVSANKKIREEFAKHISEKHPDITLFIPTRDLSTDNALMIALSGYMKSLRSNRVKPASGIKADGNLKL